MHVRTILNKLLNVECFLDCLDTLPLVTAVKLDQRKSSRYFKSYTSILPSKFDEHDTHVVGKTTIRLRNCLRSYRDKQLRISTPLEKELPRPPQQKKN